MKKLFGITTAMTTPFKEDGSVDLGAVAGQVEMLVQKGVDCLYPGGTTGEMLRMSVAEREAVADEVIRVAGGRLPVFVHCGAMAQEDTIALAKHAEAAGADGIGIVTPQYFGLSEREMEEYYVRMAGCVSPDFPVYLYNIPQCAANDISADTAQKIARRAKNVVGIKYSFADINRTMDYLRINDWTFSVMHGCDRVFVAFAALGCVGTVSGISGVFPEPFVEVYRAICAGDWEKARIWQHSAARVTDILKAGSNMSYFKEALTLRGLNGGHMRQPQLDIEPAEVKALAAELEQFCADTGIPMKA
ncbi:MAG TPA: dihydrodipicolinate synthase family protein [Eubacteriales bacterium]|nr:dihydrodipicolinate synthase family protein [Eubacteriales bacterium]